jgi:uncharacterized protein (TIGR00369 family)
MKTTVKTVKKTENFHIDFKFWKKEIENIPFVRLLGMKVTSLDENGIEMRMKVTPKLINYLGVIHGGGVTSLIDTAVFFAIRPFLPKGNGLTTTEIKANFFRAAGLGTLIARANTLHLGTRTAVGEGVILSEDGKLIAKGTVGHLILDK